MEYKCRPLYKYIALVALLFLFMFHQKTSLAYPKILAVSLIIVIFFVVMDFAFIYKHPALSHDPEEERRRKKKKQLKKQKEYMNNLIDTMTEDMDDSTESSESTESGDRSLYRDQSYEYQDSNPHITKQPPSRHTRNTRPDDMDCDCDSCYQRKSLYNPSAFGEF